MNFRFKRISATLALAAATAFLTTGCDPQVNQTAVNSNGNMVAVNTQPATTNTNVQATNSATVLNESQAANQPITLPLLDAMFADEGFAGDLKTKLSLTDEQINKLKQTARESTAGLRESDDGSTAKSRREAEEKINSIVGADKAAAFSKFVSDRWNGGENGGDNNAAAASSNQKVNSIPSDTRIVVNAPAYRMDVFKDGQLVRSYKVGIGYPEFPLPTANRKATEIIFNPTWTPPDEPWVEGSDKIKAGQKVAAGDKLNPLGPIKIPIGSPSLIHGGKQVARLGQFASHGCVGLTNPQVQDFALALAQISGTNLSGEEVLNYEKTKTETKNVKLSQSIPVELRYETIVVENGVLKIYRDVYERGTNTEENLRRTLEAYGVSLDSLTEPERAKVMSGLKQMALDAGGNPVDGNSGAANSNTGNTNANANAKSGDKSGNKNADSQGGKVTRTVKGAKEVSIPIAALKGKGYPAPVDLNTGGKSKKPLNLAGNTANQSNSNQMSQQKQNSASKKF